MALRTSLIVCLGVAIGLLAAPPAATAEDLDEPLRIDFPHPRDNPAYQQWHEQRPWQYSTDYLFGITRGLEEQDTRVEFRRAAWIATVPLDVANLPFAALAGLFGD